MNGASPPLVTAPGEPVGTGRDALTTPSAVLRLIAIYGTSTALSRAVTLLSVLYLSRYYTLGDIGTYGLAHTLSQLALPILSLGATSAIVREGVSDAATARQLVRVVALVALFGGLIVAAAQTLGAPGRNWVYLGILIGAADAVHQSLVSYCQSQERPWTALVLSLVRVSGLLTSVLVATRTTASVEDLLRLQIVLSLGIAGVSLLLLRMRADTRPLLDPRVRIAMAYSLVTVPHSAALWLISGSDRVLLEREAGTAAVGAYTMAYTVGQISLVLNSGVAAAMATRVAADYEHWRAAGVLSRFFRMVGILTLGILAISLAIVQLDRSVLHIVQWPTTPMFLLASVITAAFFISNYYVSYAAFLFYHRNTVAITVGTLVTAPMTIGVTYLLIEQFGVLGAALGTMTGYVLMAAAYLIGVRRSTGEFASEWTGHLLIGVRYVLAMAALGAAFDYFTG